MKVNCQTYTAADIAKIVACNMAKEAGRCIDYKADSCYLSEDGTFVFAYMDENGTFGARKSFSANDIAYMVNMPLWEVVGVDNGGFDELAVLFYEEK